MSANRRRENLNELASSPVIIVIGNLRQNLKGALS